MLSEGDTIAAINDKSVETRTAHLAIYNEQNDRSQDNSSFCSIEPRFKYLLKVFSRLGVLENRQTAIREQATGPWRRVKLGESFHHFEPGPASPMGRAKE